MIKSRIGQIVSANMQNTAIVSTKRMVRHPLYHKNYRRTKRFFADNPNNLYKVGDVVEICECRPISRHKCWKIIRKIKDKNIANSIEATPVINVLSETPTDNNSADKKVISKNKELQ